MAVYFLHEPIAGAVKIGHSRSVVERQDDIQCGNPAELILLGTVPGGRREEKRLHGRFAAYHVRREWFLAPPEVLIEIGAILATEGDARTVADELAARNRCREGLGGVMVHLAGMPEARLAIRGSQWDKDGHLLLHLHPPGMPVSDVPDWSWDELEESEFLYDGGAIRNVPAASCILLTRWPVTCGCWLDNSVTG